MPAERWANADARFLAGREEDGAGRWESAGRNAPEPWPIDYGPVRAEAQLTAFRHLGLFPEHQVHWDRVVADIESRYGAGA